MTPSPMPRPLDPLDPQGLVCAFELAPPAALGVEALTHPPAGPVWIHLNLTDTRALRWLEQQTDLPEAAREVLLGSDPHVFGQALPEGFVAVLGDLHHDFDGDPEGFGLLRVHVDAKRMISARRRPLRTSDRLRRELAQHKLEADSPLELFEHFVHGLAATFGQVVSGLGEETDDAEDRILAGRYQDQGLTLGRIRRTLVRLRRHLGANRTALATIAARLGETVERERVARFRQACERLDAVAQDLELVQERARLLQEEIAGRVGEDTNRNLFWLSVMTTTLLPVTLITGVFGMNVNGLPFAAGRHGFWWVLVIMGLAVVAILYFLRRRKLV